MKKKKARRAEPTPPLTAREKELPASYVIFICSDDIMDKETAMKCYTRVCSSTGEQLGDGTSIILVNGSYNGDDDIGRLMKDLLQPDPELIENQVLSSLLANMKDDEHKRRQKGDNNMVVTHFDKLLAKGHAEGRAEGVAETQIGTARRMLTMGRYSAEEIAEVTQLPVEKIKELMAE
ncbi:hypothetical protein SAMN02910456_01134 [Ruminococcaceae bacterium YRB3002]|nr:hypothetical protein SAMN02910456_01134 [Ruminococcaceae bacterium YRB3002]